MLIYIVHYLTRGIYTHHGGQSAAHGDPGERKRFAARCIIKGVAGAAMNAERGAGPGHTVWEPDAFCCVTAAARIARKVKRGTIRGMTDAQQRTPEYYREKARQIWRLALRARAPEVRLELLDIADRFARMAAHVERRNNLAETVGDRWRRATISSPP